MQSKRIAISTFFFINGLLYANWTARIPEIKEFYDVSNAGLGTLLFSMAAGSLVAMPFSGWLTTRVGTKQITWITGLLLCFLTPFIVLFQSLWIVGLFFFAMGLAVGAMDVAMNGQAVLLERDWKKPIMSSFHAIFSIGMALGAGTGALFTRFDVELFTHFTIMASFGFVALVIASRFLIADKPEKTAKSEGESSFVLPTKAILPLGIIAFCGMVGESSMADWSALFMNTVVGQSEYISAFAFGTFAVSMTIGRVFGDYLTEKIGTARLLSLDSILAITGLSIALFFATPLATFLGFFIVGLGLATIVPIVYSTAGNTSGVNPSIGIAMATTIGYAGFFVGPPTIGFLSDAFGLRIGLGFTLFLFAMMFFIISNHFKTQEKIISRTS
jgi:MFS family permease